MKSVKNILLSSCLVAFVAASPLGLAHNSGVTLLFQNQVKQKVTIYYKSANCYAPLSKITMNAKQASIGPLYIGRFQKATANCYKTWLVRAVTYSGSKVYASNFCKFGFVSTSSNSYFLHLSVVKLVSGEYALAFMTKSGAYYCRMHLVSGN